MHGFSSGSTFLVNAEVDSMGGVVDGGVGIGNRPSPRRAAIEKAQAELRLEYDVREERRRELEFLEKGGNPLDFKFCHAATVSVQSTSHTCQHPDQIFTSEAKGSFALTASPHGDSVESSGRLGVTTACEPNSADNFDGENEIFESERKLKNSNRICIRPSEHLSQLDRSQNVKELDDSLIFHPKKGQAYRRRNRSRPNPRLSSSDMASHGGTDSFPGRHALVKHVASENQLDIESDGSHTLRLLTTSRASENADGKLNILCSKDRQDGLQIARVAVDFPAMTTTVKPDLVEGKENVEIDAGGVSCSSIEQTGGIEQKEGKMRTAQLDESCKINGDVKSMLNNAPISNATVLTKGLDSEASCTHKSHSADGNGNTESDLLTNLKNVGSNGVPKEQKLPPGEKSRGVDSEMLMANLDTNLVESAPCVNQDQSSISHHANDFTHKDQIVDKEMSSGNKFECATNVAEQRVLEHSESKKDKAYELSDASIPKAENSCPVRPPSSVDPTEFNNSELCAHPLTLKLHTSSESQPRKIDKAQEDRVLEEARIIEAKRKRISELSVGMTPRENRRKSHWDFVLEEMTWLANDFTQERVWKMTAAAQICHRVAFASRLRMEEQSKSWKQKSAAQTLAKDVMEFWHSARLYVESDTCFKPENCKLVASSGVYETVLENGDTGDQNKDDASVEKEQSSGNKQALAVFGYAVRFLQDNCSSPSLVKVEGSGTLDVTFDVDITELFRQDLLTEENLFYVVPPGAMETYRKSIESCLATFEMVSNSIREVVEKSMYEPSGEIVYQENDYEEDEGENVYYHPGSGFHDNGKPLKKKMKNMTVYANRYDVVSDYGYGHVDKKGTPPSVSMGKRSANNLPVGSIPTKRIRTAPRPRVVSPFTPGSAGVASLPTKTDASSGDTNSFQDDQSTLHGTFLARGSEVDSPMDYDKQLMIDSSEYPGKPKKKKKFKNQGASYPGWPVDPALQNDQKDHVRKRHDHPLESNGNSGSNVHHMKKPKIKHSENSFENIPASGSVASPVASQMSNMSSQSKIIKILGGRERRKAKGIKVPAVQPGSGSLWSSFEDQALIVLVHDMGPNWELVSDAINSTLRFKCIFRKPQECKERHKVLMDRTPGDGADSAEDSGSSQPYPSTLPGIPKGSARQLFQQLQRPMVEDTIKSHFDKIIHIAKQLHNPKKQNENQDMKQLAPVHGSHVAALSQVIPNNVNGVILTPLDLCDFSASNQDAIPLGFQGPHAGGLSMSNHGASPMHPSGGLNSSVQGLPGSPSMGMGNNLSSQSSQIINSQDARYPVPRATSLSIEEQHRLQQYGQMLPGRNVQSSNMSSGSLSGTARGVRILPGGSGVGMVAGMSRSIARPGLQGIASSSMLNTGSVVSSNMGGVPSNMNMHSGTTSSQGNSMFRPRDALHRSSDHQRQMILPEASSSSVPPFSGLSSGFTNQTASPPLQPYGGSPHQQQHLMPQQHSHMLGGPHHIHLPGAANHSITPEQQQAYLRLARERQIQQRILQRQHQQQQLPASGALIAHAQSPPSSVQSGSQLKSPPSSQPVSLAPLTPSSPMTHVSSQPAHQQKHQVSSQGLGRNPQSGAGGLMNQVGKQCQRQATQQIQQQYQQTGRQHPQQRQQSQSAKLPKGTGRKDMLMHQNLPMDPSRLNGLTANSGNQVAEKGEQTVHFVQSQGLYPGSGLNEMPPSKSLASPQASGHLQQKKPYANSIPATPKQVQQIPSQRDGSSRGPVVSVSSSPTSTGMTSFSHQQLQGHSQPPRKVINQSQPVHQRAIQQNHQLHSDPLTKSQSVNVVVEPHFANNTNLNAGVQPAGDSTSSLPLSSSARSSVRKQVQGSLVDCTMTSTPSTSEPISSLVPTESSGNVTLPAASEALGQRQLSVDLGAHVHGVKSQHQQSPLHNASSLQPILSQKQSQHQLKQLDKSPQRLPQPQPQSQIQAGQNSVLTSTSNSSLE